MKTPHHRRERIVTLTQVEIMLVLAIIILVLAAAKNADLNEARLLIADSKTRGKVLEDEKNDLAEKLAAAENAAQKTAANTPPAPSDLDEEITEELISGGGGEKRPPLGKTTALSVSAKNTAAESLPEKKEPTVKQESAAQNTLRAENARLKNEIAALQQNARRAAAAQKIKNEVGFLPCWPGAQKRRYYFAYNITYFPGGDNFRIAPHPDLASGAEVVRRALAGELAALNDYPRGLISRRLFLQFAKKITAAQKRLYGNECRLAVTINKRGVDLTITNDFIYRRAGFYPAGRE